MLRKIMDAVGIVLTMMFTIPSRREREAMFAEFEGGAE